MYTTALAGSFEFSGRVLGYRYVVVEDGKGEG